MNSPTSGLPTSQLVFLALLGVMIAARLVELGVARRLTVVAKARGESPRREFIFIAMVTLHAAIFPACAIEVIAFDRPFYPWLAILSISLLIIAGMGRVWTLRTLGANWNVRIVKPASVVVVGPYRFIRHPNYAVVITELLCLPLFHDAYVTAISATLLNALILARRIPAEEKVLFELPGYAEKMGGKPRFFPRISAPF